jgi:hypothetical protein
MNTYDQQIYAIGRGPSSVTVAAPLTTVEVADTIVISGKVNDVSPGTTQEEIKLRFPNGIPAVSDNNQTAWMRYIYQQLPKPTNIQGVQVTLNVLDANGNYRTIGTTTTDETGYYSFTWNPDISGKYTVTAIFEGTAAYYGSSDQTAFYASEQAATPTSTNAPQVSAIEQYFLPAVAAIIAAIAIVGIVLGLLILRKHP